MSEVEKLREESLGFQEYQAKLQLWKLIAIGSVASISLGITTNNVPQYWLLGLLPFISIYVDLQLRQNDLKICVISKFIKSSNSGPIAKYERAIESDEFSIIGVWDFYVFSVPVSTLVVAIFVLTYGIETQSLLLKLCGISGGILTILIELIFRKKFAAISRFNFNNEI